MKRTVFTYNPMLTRDSVETKAQWKGGISGDKRTALISCPECGEVVSLSTHTIADNGEVSPSLVCPLGCGFHEFITLEDWKP